MKNPAKRELIAEIAEVFKDHEETYETGQWEAFLEQKGNKNSFFIQWLSIAAAFFIIISLLPFHLNDLITRGRSADFAVVKKEMNSDGNKSDVVVKLNVSPAKKNEISKRGTILPVQQIENVESGGIERGNVSPVQANLQVDTLSVRSTAPEKQMARAMKTDLKKDNFLEFLQKETVKESKLVSQKKGSNWNFGVELLPTMTKSNVNLGAGLTTEYKLSKSFSVGSGISFIQLGADQNFNQSTAIASTVSSKRLISTDANISAIDIPISLTYNLNQHLYTSIGVSYFNVLSEKRNNGYLTELPVSRTSADPITGLNVTRSTVLVGENKEVATDLPLNGNSYLGFFNFSVGRKQEIFNKYNIILEPFIKIPVGKLSNEDLKLTNGGMKVKFSF